jgi:2-polyprenyl-6-methoxyphenol hydroxylase-like FAD-dependent oxidoreductase
MMSLSGPGYEAAGRMGLLERLQQVRHRGGESIYRDRHGRELLRLQHGSFLEDLPYLVLRRTDLVDALAQEVRDACEVRLATEVVQLDARADFVDVVLSDGDRVRADLVIGADGINSSTRSLVIPADQTVLKPLGYRFAAYDVADTLGLGADFLSYAAPGRISEFYRVAEGRLAALNVWTRAAAHPDLAPIDELKRVVHDDHPQVRSILDAAIAEARPILIDDMLLVEAPTWSRGRVVLLGDAAHSISLISGQGAGMAMTGAAVLAEEIGRRADIGEALGAYETRMRGPIARLQARSRNIARWFVPHSPLAFHARNFALRHMPSWMLASYFRRSVQSEIFAAQVR